MNMTSHQTNLLPVALTIAGFDPSGGAGIIADIKTFTAFGCFATAAVTSLTFQNTIGVFGARTSTAEDVRGQVLPIIEDFEIAALKTGMLPTRDVIEEVARLVRERKLPAPVVDPVVSSTSGYDLIDAAALETLKRELFPLARVITPNIPEAERLTQLKINDENAMRHAAKILREKGARSVLVKGGHLKASRKAEGGRRKGDEEKSLAIDVLDDEGTVTVFRAPRIEMLATHGTGCTLAAAIAACLAHGLTLKQAVEKAKAFVTEAIRRAPPIGHGARPLNHNILTSDF